MTKDYAKKRRSSLANSAKGRYSRVSQPSSLWPAWIWIPFGLVTGVLASIIVYWHNHNTPIVPEKVTFEIEDNDKTNVRSTKRKRIAVAKDESGARFDFYKLLPNLADEQIAYEAQLAGNAFQGTASLEKKAAEKFTSPLQPQQDKSNLPPYQSSHLSQNDTGLHAFVIQAGSFRQLPQAEELKAQLAMIGFQASIQTININEKGTWFRVTIGPFKNKEAAKTQQEKLEHAFKLHSVLIKNRV